MEQCAICGSEKNLEKHHLKPLSKGGTEAPENIVFLCKPCHRHKVDYGFAKRKVSPFENNSSLAASFYIGDPYKKVWQEFRVICLREGTTASKKLVEFISKYVKNHEPGNPQQLVSTFFEGGAKAYVAPKCFVCKNEAVTELVNLKGLKRFFCLRHETAALESGKWNK